MKNKFTKAMTSLLLSSSVIIPMGSPIMAEEPIQTATQSTDSFMNAYLSRKIVQNGAVTYEPFKSVDDTNYVQILQSESVYAAMSDSLKAEINSRVLANTGMDYTSLLTAAKDKQKAVAQASTQPSPAAQSTVDPDHTAPSSVDTNTAAQSTTEQPAQSSTQPAADKTQANSSTTASAASTVTTRTAATAMGVQVTAVYSEDTFSEDVNLTVSDVSKSNRSYSIDIGFKKADGTEAEPNAGKDVSIQITYPSLQGTEFEVVHTNDNQTSASVNVSSVNATSASFTTHSFSVFTVQSKAVTTAVQAADKQAESVSASEKADPTQTREKTAASSVKENSSVSATTTDPNTVAKTSVETTADNENKTTTPIQTNVPTIVKADTEQEDSISAQANAFITTYLTSSTGVVYESANAGNYQYILNSGSAWNQLSVEVRRKVNQILTSKIGKTYLKLLTEAKNIAGTTPSTGIETKAVSYSVMLGTSLLGIISATRKKKEQM